MTFLVKLNDCRYAEDSVEEESKVLDLLVESLMEGLEDKNLRIRKVCFSMLACDAEQNTLNYVLQFYDSG